MMVSFSIIVIALTGLLHTKKVVGMPTANKTNTGNPMVLPMSMFTKGMEDINMTCVGEELLALQGQEPNAAMMSKLSYTCVAEGGFPAAAVAAAGFEEEPGFLPRCSPFKVKRFPDGKCKGFLEKRKSSKRSRKSNKNKKGEKEDKKKRNKSESELVDVASTNEDEDGLNKYAWGGDCTAKLFRGEEREVCVIVQSAGTESAIARTPSKPVITIRAGKNIPEYGDQEIIAKVKINEFFVGLRAAEVWKINFDDTTGALDSVELIFGDLTNTEASLFKYTIYIESFEDASDNIGACTTNIVTKEVLVGPNSVSNTVVPGTTIRSVRRLEGSVCGGNSYFNGGKDRIVFAVFSDSLGGGTGNPPPSAVVYVYDPNDPTSPPIPVIVDKGPSLTWDFKLDTSSSKAYYVVAIPEDLFNGGLPTQKNGPYDRINALGEKFTDLRYGNFDLIPSFYSGELSDLCVNTPKEIEAKEFLAIRDTNVGSAGTIEPLDDGKVLYCSLSGFLYQQLRGAGLDGAFSGIPELRPELPANIFEGREIGYPQECFICDTNDDSCQQFIPRFQNELSVYIWSATECGGKVFIGTLDLSNLIFLSLKDFISSIPSVAAIVAEGNLITERVFDTFVYIVLTILLNILGVTSQPLSPYEFGFNVMYADADDLSKCVGLDCGSIWKYVTTDGFTRLPDPDEPFVIAGLADPNEELGIFGYLRPDLNVEDGVRQLVCSSDKYLHVGSTGYGDVGSNTYIVDIDSDKGNDLCPEQEAIDALISSSTMFPPF